MELEIAERSEYEISPIQFLMSEIELEISERSGIRDIPPC